MKTLIALMVVLTGIEAQAASLYMCRSYNAGSIVVADMNARTVEFKDRFGNELNKIEEVSADFTVLSTEPLMQEILLTKNEEFVFLISEQGSFIQAQTKEDDSFMCFSVN